MCLIYMLQLLDVDLGYLGKICFLKNLHNVQKVLKK